MLRAMAQKNHRSAVLLRVRPVKSGGEPPEVRRVRQQGAAHGQGVKSAGEGFRFGPEPVVFKAVEQMGGLHRRPADAFGTQPLQSLRQTGHILPPFGEDAQDGGAGKGLDRLPVRGGPPQDIFHRRDGPAGLRDAGAEADKD